MAQACSVTDCSRTAAKRGWCFMHYTRWHRHGDPLVKKSSASRSPVSLGRLLTRVVWTPAGCWEWQGALNQGYGVATCDGERGRVHRLVYARLVGEPPAGLDLDHLCRNRKCCNPLHLEPVTRAENLRRGIGPEVTRQRFAARRTAAVGGQ